MSIKKAREDENVKAIVLRVNSPGGDALASDVIWREVSLAAKSKPVVASFGDVAASGGYYISCAATKIMADPTTITGSIGVFGLVPNMKGMFNNKLGITFDNEKTNKNADYITVTSPLSPFQTGVLQNEIEHIYSTFVSKVAEGRKMTKESVDSIGQGRVWCAADAKRIGLVDAFGGLKESIEEAAKLANVSNYRIISLPEQKDLFTQIYEEFMGGVKASLLEKELGEDYIYYRSLKEVKSLKGVQARMPFEIILN
jgi:protease-4